jgi:diguanylate cyclase
MGNNPVGRLGMSERMMGWKDPFVPEGRSKSLPESGGSGPADGPADPVSDIARKVILTMSRNDVPLSPENYWVWFDYVTGRNQALCNEIDEHLKKETTFSESVNRELYDRHVGPWHNANVMDEVSQELQLILQESLEKITATGSDTKEYAGKLKDFLSGLETKNRDPSALKEMIITLLVDTRAMEQSSKELREELQKAEKEATELRDRLRRVEREATLDILTGLHNRQYLEKELAALYEGYQRNRSSFSVIMIDLDHFKVVNDTYGHKVGDAVLQFIGGVIKGAVKGRDFPARYGGEEFLILLPATSCANASKLADQLREEISRKPLTIRQSGERIGSVTVSAGVAEICRGDTVDTLLERADQALYLAKGQGRNNVKCEADLHRNG